MLSLRLRLLGLMDLFTLHTLLNAIICCFQLNTEWGADANRKVDYLDIDAVGLTVYVLCCNAQWKS